MIKIKFSIIDVEFDTSYLYTGEFTNYHEAQQFMCENRAVGNTIHVLVGWHRANLQHTKLKNFLKILG